MTPIHTAAFYFGWTVVVVAAFFVVHFVRIAARAFGGFWTRNITPLLTRFRKFANKLMDDYDVALLCVGVATTLFGTLVCAASTRWIGITDVRSFAFGIVILVVGMAATIRSAD